MEFNIFVSYSTHDLEQVNLLHKQLTDTSISVFVAEHSVRPSEELAPKISSAIEGCDLFIVLWSENAKNSDWVSQEIGRASALQKPILPLVLTEGLNLPGFIGNLKYLPVYSNTAAALTQAREIVMAAYEQKLQLFLAQQKEQKQKDSLALMGLGAFLLWAFSQK